MIKMTFENNSLTFRDYHAIFDVFSMVFIKIIIKKNWGRVVGEGGDCLIRTYTGALFFENRCP